MTFPSPSQQSCSFFATLSFEFSFVDFKKWVSNSLSDDWRSSLLSYHLTGVNADEYSKLHPAFPTLCPRFPNPLLLLCFSFSTFFASNVLEYVLLDYLCTPTLLLECKFWEGRALLCSLMQPEYMDPCLAHTLSNKP